MLSITSPCPSYCFRALPYPRYLRCIIHPTPPQSQLALAVPLIHFFEEPLIHTGCVMFYVLRFSLALPPTIHTTPISSPSLQPQRPSPSTRPISDPTSFIPYVHSLALYSPRYIIDPQPPPFMLSSKDHGYALSFHHILCFLPTFSTTFFPHAISLPRSSRRQ